MDIMKILGIAVIGLAVCVLFRQYKPEYGMLVGLITSLVILGLIFLEFSPVLNQLEVLLDGVGLPSEYGMILIKSLGICILAQLGSDACNDAGETAIAGKVELAGKIAVLLLSLPLFTKLLSIASGLIAG